MWISLRLSRSIAAQWQTCGHSCVGENTAITLYLSIYMLSAFNIQDRIKKKNKKCHKVIQQI